MLSAPASDIPKCLTLPWRMILDGAGDLFDGHVRVNPMLVE
jgi:hypothetical protein